MAAVALSHGRVAWGSHFPARAKRVIHIFAQGAPSHVDTWDPKPELTRLDGQDLPGMNGVAMGSPFIFTPRGKSGIEVSEADVREAFASYRARYIRQKKTD